MATNNTAFRRVSTETVGAFIRRVREAHGLTITEFAASLNVSASTVSSWESEQRWPRGPARAALFAALGIDRDALTPEEDGGAE